MLKNVRVIYVIIVVMKAIHAAIAHVLANMNDESQYHDFLEMFERIEAEMKGVVDERVKLAYLMLETQLYINKGDLDSVRDQMVGRMEACK